MLNFSQAFAPHNVTTGIGYASLGIGVGGLANDLYKRASNIASAAIYAYKEFQATDEKEKLGYSQIKSLALTQATSQLGRFFQFAAVTLIGACCIRLVPHIEQLELVGDRIIEENLYDNTLNNITNINRMMDETYKLYEQFETDMPYYEELIANTTQTLEGMNTMYADFEKDMPYYEGLASNITKMADDITIQMQTLDNSTIPAYLRTVNNVAFYLKYIPFIG